MTERDYFESADWIGRTIIYEVNLRQYSDAGTINAFSTELGRLNDMGIETLWFMPIHPIGKLNRKGSLGSYYSIADFEDVNPEFGTKADFKKLIDKAHTLGMKVIMDWVANHAAWDNVWTKSNPHFFMHDERGDFVSPNDWSDVIQINHNSPAQKEAMINAMKYWVEEFDIDGFRADLAHLTPLSFWKEARQQTDTLKEGLFWLAETEEINYHEAFDASFTWKWMHKTEDFYKQDRDINNLKKVLQEYNSDFPATAYRMYFTSNHDENTWTGTEYEKYGDMAKALAVFSFTWNGIPMIYSGQELPNLNRLAFFEKDIINWSGEFLLHDFYKTLCKLKKNNKALLAADADVVTTLFDTGAASEAFAFARKCNDDIVFVLLNFSEHDQRFNVLETVESGTYVDVFSGLKINIDADHQFELKPWQFIVLEKKG